MNGFRTHISVWPLKILGGQTRTNSRSLQYIYGRPMSTCPVHHSHTAIVEECVNRSQNYTDSINRKKKKTYFFPRCWVSGHAQELLLHCLDNHEHDDNNYHYHQESDYGGAHPLSRVLLQRLCLLEGIQTMLYVVGSIWNLGITNKMPASHSLACLLTKSVRSIC